MAIQKCLNCMADFDNTGTGVCPYCGHDQNAPKKEAYHLDPGSFLCERYIIGRSIGSGGFGITYIAWDTVLDKKVAIKEYFPTEFGTRIVGATEVCAYDGEKSYQFDAGLNSFVEEAMHLAKLNSIPHIVHIYDSFTENCTAYIVMDFVEGRTLMELLKEKGPLPYEEVIGYVVPVLDSLHLLHQEGIIHRDIAPDNILIHHGEPVLIDFGSARNATTFNSKSLSVIIKPGYSPWEQYLSRGDQRAWTDVYAMAAVMYHLITGKLPQDSSERIVKDELKTPTEIGFPLPEHVENAIMNALNVKPEYRIQTAKEFADALRGDIKVERVVDTTKDKTVVKLSKKAKLGILTAAVAAVAAIILIIVSTTDINHWSKTVGAVLPNMEGMEYSEAVKKLDKFGVNFVVDGTLELQGVAEDSELVAWQSVEAGTPIDSIEVLNVKVAKAPVKRGKMPSLTALTKAEAEKALKDAGFTNFTFTQKENNRYKEGLVCEQSVKANKQIPLENKIAVYIAKNTTTTTKATTKAPTQRQKMAARTTKRQTTTQKPTTTKKKSDGSKTTEKKHAIEFGDDED